MKTHIKDRNMKGTGHMLRGLFKKAGLLDELKLSKARQIMIEINKTGGNPLENLRNKAQWEHCSQLKVILNWGDPRKW